MKRIISFLMSMAMIFTMLPTGAFATTVETEPVSETQAVTEAPAEPETEAVQTEAAETAPAETAEAAAVETEAPAAETMEETVAETVEETVEETEPAQTEVAETVAEEALATAEDDFRAAVAAAEASGENLPIWDEITLTSDLTINMTGELSFADYSKLVVPSGVTLTLNGPVVFNGATLVVEAGGKLVNNVNLSIVAPMNPATFDMNGEFVNNGDVWVNEGATVNINGTAISYYRNFHVGFGGNGKTSTLNINGTLTTYGYLNIADAGAPGVLNVNGTLILEKDENGNGYLQAASPVNVSGTLDNRAAVTIGNDAGTAVLTIAQGGEVTVAGDSMWFDIVGGGTLVNNGTLTNHFYQICNYGTLTNNGTLNNPAKIRNYGTYTANGTINGNAPVDGVEDARNMFLDGITYATANGESLSVWDEVILTDDLTINMAGELSFADYSKLVVPSGVTLTLNGPTFINNAELIVEKGGKLVNNSLLVINAPNDGPGKAVIEGELVNNDTFQVNTGSDAYINGTATNSGYMHVGLGGGGILHVNGTLSTTGYLNIHDGATLMVNEGAVLDIQNIKDVGCGYLDNQGYVQMNGTMNLDGIFTTGAAQEDGVIVGGDASAEIRGTVIGSATSSMGVLEKGAVNIISTMTTTGEVKVEPNGALWVDGTMTMNGPAFLYVGGWLHVNFFDEDANKGVLNVNTTANVNFFGYLAVHGGGTLNVGESGVVNITNDERGCAYLDNQGTVTMNGTMNLDGIFTTGAPQDGEGNIIGRDAFTTINGTVNGSATSSLGVLLGGTLTNNGTVTTAGELNIEGIWLGNAPVVEEKLMSFEDFKAAMASGFVQLEAKVTIEENLEVTSSLYVFEGGEIIVPSGVTLTLTSYTQIVGGKITVEQGGCLVNNTSIYVSVGSVLDVQGTYSAGQYNWLTVEDGASTVTGIDKSLITLQCYADTEEALRAALEKTGYREQQIHIRQSIRLSTDLVLTDGLDVQIYNGAELTVPSGVTLTVAGDLHVFDAGIAVENGGTLRVTESSYLQVQSGYLRSEGTVETAPQRIHVDLSNGVEITGVDTSLVSARCSVGTYEELCNAVAACSEYAFLEIEPYATIVVENDLMIPGNAMFAMYDDGELMQLIIPEGVTLTNYGSIVINSNCQIWIQAGATLDNQGGLNAYHETALIVDGTLLDNNPGGGGEDTGITTLEGLLAAVEAGKEWIEIRGSITLTEDLIIPSVSYVSIYEDGEIIVPEGVTLTLLGGMSIYNSMLTVEAGGAVVLSGGIYVDGTIVVDSKASFTITERGNMTVAYGSTVTGIDKTAYTLEYIAETEADIRAGLKLTGYGWTSVHLAENVTLTSNLTIPKGASLLVGYYWYEDNSITATLTVPSGVTVTNNGTLSIVSPTGCLNIQKGGKLVNNSDFYVYGTLINEGTITGNGYMDYARPAYSYEELVALLNADMVPTYIYIRETLTLEGDVTIPEGIQLIVEGGNLIVPSGCTVTINGLMVVQLDGVATFEEGSKLVNNNSIEAYYGTINIYGKYVEGHEDVHLLLDSDSAINGVDNKYVYYMVSFYDEASLVAALNKVATEGYGEATVYVQYGCDLVEVSGNVTVPENVYLMMGSYGDSMVLKSGAVLTNYGVILVFGPGSLVVEEGAQLVNRGELIPDGGSIIYEGGGISIGAEATAVYGKGKLNLSAAITPETFSGAKVTWTLAEGHELYASIKGSGSKATLTAEDVTGMQTVKVIASATLSNGAEVSDTIEITIVPLTKQITIVSDGQDVTGKTISFDLNYIPEGKTEAQRTLDLTAIIAPGDAEKNLTWTSSSEAIATVEGGKVTFTDKGGKVTITAAANDGSRVSAKVTIEAVKLVQSITLLSGDAELVGGKGTTLKVQDASNPGKALAASAVTWALADEKDAAYVTVTAAGKVTTKAVPERIRVTLLGTIVGNPNAKPLEHTITVYPAVTQVDLRDGDLTYTGQTVKLSAGETIILQAAMYPADSMGGVTWELSDKDGKLATVVSSSPESLILQSTGVKGNVTVKITSTDGSKKSASVKLQTGTYVSELVVSSPAIELVSGESVQLNLAVKPENADNKAVVWSLADANDKQYVSVSSSGKVTAKKGLSMSKDITILATAKDGYGAVGSYTFRLQPADPGALVILGEDGNVTGTTLRVDLLSAPSVKLKAKYFNTDSADVTWSGKGVTFSEEDANGFVTATVSAKGTFTVTADDGNGKKATVKLQAANLSEGLAITGGTSVASGKTLQLTATVLPEGKVADKKVDWWVDEAHAAYAKISSSGKLTATKNLTDARNITVWAQAKDGNSEPVSVNIDILPLAQSVQLLEAGTDVTNRTVTWDLTANTGKLNLSAEVFPADAGQGVTWKISGGKVVELAADGSWSFTGKTGTATITATASDGSGKKASFKLTVLKSMEFIQQSQDTAIIAGGKSLKLASFVTVDSNATNKKLTWSMTGDTEVATLSTAGVLKTKKVTDMKTITVTAEAQDGSGCKAEFTVFVYPATTSVKLLCDGEAAPKQATLGIGETLTLEGISLPSTAAQGPGAYTWKSSSDKFVTLTENPDGTVTVTGLEAGTATITCTAADGSGKKATIKIKVG